MTLRSIFFVALLAQPAPLWRVEPLLRIGSLDDEASALSEVGGVAVAPDQTIYIAQPTERHIKVFDRHGAFVTQIGREGAGPGEFRAISNLALHDGKLSVQDVVNGRLTQFDLTGNVLRTYRTPAIRLPAPYILRAPLAIAADGRQYELPTSHGAAEDYPFFVVDREGTTRQIGRVLFGRQTIRQRVGQTVAVVPQSVHGGTLYAIDPRTGDVLFVERPLPQDSRPHDWHIIRIATTGDTVFRRTFQYTPVRVNERAVERERERQIARTLAGGHNVPRPVIEEIWREGLQVPPYHAAVDQIVVAVTGEIWLRRGAIGDEPSEWTVLDATGHVIGSLRLGPGRRVAWASDRLVAIIERDEFDVEYVSLNRIIR